MRQTPFLEFLQDGRHGALAPGALHPLLGAVGAIMLFASGGILYLLFQDIAPQSRLERHWAPTLGAVIGFCFAMLAEMLVGGH